MAPPDGVLDRRWRTLCDEFGFLLGVDEVKCGYGRVGHDVRRRAVGRASRPDGARQGDGRRRDADRRRPGDRAGDGVRRPVDRVDVVVVPGVVRRGARDARGVPRGAGARERPRAGGGRARGARGDRRRRRGVGDVRAVGCFQAIELVRDRATKERDADAAGAAGARHRRAGDPRRREHDVAQHPALAGARARPAARRVRRDRRGPRRRRRDDGDARSVQRVRRGSRPSGGSGMEPGRRPGLGRWRARRALSDHARRRRRGGRDVGRVDARARGGRCRPGLRVRRRPR